MSQAESRAPAAPATIEWWAILLIVLGSIAVGIPMLHIPGGIIVAIVGGVITGLVLSVTTENIRFKHQQSCVSLIQF
jgi:hypothetical protein